MLSRYTTAVYTRVDNTLSYHMTSQMFTFREVDPGSTSCILAMPSSTSAKKHSINTLELLDITVFL